MLLDLLLLDHNHHHRIVITTVGRVSSLRFPRTPPFCSSPSFSCCRLTHSFPKHYPQMTKRKKKVPPSSSVRGFQIPAICCCCCSGRTDDVPPCTHSHARTSGIGHQLARELPVEAAAAAVPVCRKIFTCCADAHTHARTHDSRFKRRRRRISRILCCGFTRSSICTLISWPGWC